MLCFKTQHIFLCGHKQCEVLFQMKGLRSMANIVCKHCGCTEYHMEEHGPHTGAYCNNCGRFIKWVPKGAKGGTHSYNTINYGNNANTNSGLSEQVVHSNLPEPVKGTEKVQVQYTSTGTLVLRMDGKQCILYNAEGMTERPRIILKHGSEKFELLSGDILDIYVM